MFYKAIILFILNFLGVINGGCGDSSIRLRPPLIFQEKHANLYLDILRTVLKEVSTSK